MELTKEYFDKKFASLGKVFVSKEYFDKQNGLTKKDFDKQNKLTRQHFDRQTRLTKEYFDKKLVNFATKDDLRNFPTKDDLDTQLATQTQELKTYTGNSVKESSAALSKELKAFAVKQTEELARILNNTFTEQQEYLEDRFTGLAQALDVRERVYSMEHKFRKIEETFDIKL